MRIGDKKMKAVRIELLETDATFALPLSKSDVFTYLLPPPSTIIGMVHRLCKWNSYHEMDVSVYNTEPFVNTYSNLEHRWYIGEFPNVTEDIKKRWPIISQKEDGRYQGTIMSPKDIHHVSELHLVLHIIPKNPDEIDHIYRCLLNPHEFPSLGQHHDLIDIKQVKVVEVSNSKKNIMFDGLAYRKYENLIMIPATDKGDSLELAYIENNIEKKKIISKEGYTISKNLILFETNTTIYNLHKNYQIKGKFRRWNNVKAMLYNGCTIDDNNYINEFVDEDGKPIFIL